MHDLNKKWTLFNLLKQNILGLPNYILYDDVIKWKHFPRYWPFVRGILRSQVISLHKGRWRGTLMFSLICARINGWVNNSEAGDLRRHCAHCDVTVMKVAFFVSLYMLFPSDKHHVMWEVNTVERTTSAVIGCEAIAVCWVKHSAFGEY